MPGISGISIYRELLAERPDLARRFVLVTGDMIGAQAEIEALPRSSGRRSWKSRSARWTCAACLSAIAEQAALKAIKEGSRPRCGGSKKRAPGGALGGSEHDR